MDPYAHLTAAVGALLASARPVLLGIAGGVGVGKSTMAEGLRERLVGAAVPTEVVGTDAFLLPNDELAQRELTTRKGFPESFDTEALDAFLRAARAGRPELRVPVYSHLTYDRVPDGERVLSAAEVLIVEGVNALMPPVLPHLDVAVYIDADADDVQRWFVDRFLAFCEAAEDDPSSFYAAFAGMSEEVRRDIALWTWREINLVNLHDHIAPSRAGATIVVSKRADHSIRRIGSPT